MIDISILIFLAALIALVAIFFVKWRRLGDSEGEEYPSKDLSYENFQKLQKQARYLWLTVIHGGAIIVSKTWARITHFISGVFHKGAKRIEREIMKHEKNGAGEGRQSVFLTTVKTYKHEIKKLKGRVEEELPRPRMEPIPPSIGDEEVAILKKSDTIDETEEE